MKSECNDEKRSMRELFKAFIDKEIKDGMVIIACGLPATNKTETTEVIARLKGYTMLRTDIIRKEDLKGEDIFNACKERPVASSA
jgi:hypothetical protein